MSNSQQRLAWRLAEISAATGLSVAFLRLSIRRGALRARKVGGAVLVLDDDLRSFLEGDGETEDSVGIRE